MGSNLVKCRRVKPKTRKNVTKGKTTQGENERQTNKNCFVSDTTDIYKSMASVLNLESPSRRTGTD